MKNNFCVVYCMWLSSTKHGEYVRDCMTTVLYCIYISTSLRDVRYENEWSSYRHPSIQVPSQTNIIDDRKSARDLNVHRTKNRLSTVDEEIRGVQQLLCVDWYRHPRSWKFIYPHAKIQSSSISWSWELQLAYSAQQVWGLVTGASLRWRVVRSERRPAGPGPRINQ